MEKAIQIFEDHRGKDQPDLALMYSNYGLILKHSGKDEEGYKQHCKGLAIYEKLHFKNDLVAAIFLRTIIFFEEEVTFEEAEGYLLSCLKFVQDEFENLLSIAFVNYCLGICQHKNNRSRDGVNTVNTALNCVRKYFGKDKANPDNDSPLEVVCMMEMAGIHSDMNEHKQAVQWQEDAVQLCVKNMGENAPLLLEPYVLLAKIYLKAAKFSDNKKLYADALEYKVKAEQFDPKIVGVNKELDEAGLLYEIPLKDEKGGQKTQMVVIPACHYSQFETDFHSGLVSDLNKYGYIVPPEKRSLKIAVSEGSVSVIEAYTQKYGPVNTQFTNQG
jgi:tetratricopeptide (TPR) repeat protein